MRLSKLGHAFRGQMCEKVRFDLVGTAHPQHDVPPWMMWLDLQERETNVFKFEQSGQMKFMLREWSSNNMNLFHQYKKPRRQVYQATMRCMSRRWSDESLSGSLKLYWQVIFQTCFPRLNESDPAQTLDRNEAVETWVLGLRSNLNGVRS